MGQCMSRKAAGAFAASAAAAHQRPIGMHRHQILDESPNDEKETSKKHHSVTKGVAMSFGFRKRPVTAPPYTGNPAAARRLASADVIDRNGNGDTEPLTTNAVPSGRTTPRLAPPKKEANATRVSRFGFRQPNANRLNKISDINAIPPTRIEYKNNNVEPVRIKSAFTAKVTSPVDSNRNCTAVKSNAAPHPAKFMLHSSNLPRPELPVRVVESKTAKTLANNNRKVNTATQQQSADDNSSKDGSLTEDSGVGSHVSGGVPEAENLQQGIEVLNGSPTFGVRRSRQKPRNLGIVVSGNTFDVRDIDDSTETTIPLPRLPSAFQNTGVVRERTLEYQRNIDRSVDRNRRKISVTSSEGCSDYGEEQKTYREKCRNEKNITKPTPVKTFLKSRQSKGDSSPPSSDDQFWGNAAGEAMADDFSCSFSSSDESKDKEQPPIVARQVASNTVTAAFETLINATLTNSLPKNEIRNVLLTIEDPKFAAVAAASKTSNLIEDETSPTESLVCSYSESDEFKKKLSKSSSNSKDVNEKATLSPSSPGTPTNASNSLSLSDGKDFLIDDEIADQPALVFDDTITLGNSESLNITQMSENTLIETTPKPKRKLLGKFEPSPVLQRNRKVLLNRTDSVETLSACESIASDDLMLDFEYSQGSGMDDSHDRTERRALFAVEDSLNRTAFELSVTDLNREWSAFGNLDRSLPKPVNRTRLLRSRTGTPCSIPDSPRSLDSRVNIRGRSSVSQSPLRFSRAALASPIEYESDDSIKLDRTNHCAMVQEVMSMKTMLLKLKRILHEQGDEDLLLRSDTHNPFDTRKNGLFNGLGSDGDVLDIDDMSNPRVELEDLRRQVIFLQGLVEDKELAVKKLQEEMHKLVNENYTSNSAPASTTCVERCNAATQTDRIRPISAGPSLLQNLPTDGNAGTIVSANESPRRSRLPSNEKSPHSPNILKPQSKLWRKPGEPPSPQRYSGNSSLSSIPRRSCSRTRAPPTPS